MDTTHEEHVARALAPLSVLVGQGWSVGEAITALTGKPPEILTLEEVLARHQEGEDAIRRIDEASRARKQ
jgi:hypothetical protein